MSRSFSTDARIAYLVHIPKELAEELERTARLCNVAPDRYCEEIIEQWCAERRLTRIIEAERDAS